MLFGRESTYGTGVTLDSTFGLVQNFKFNINNNTTGNRGMKTSTSSGRNVVKFTHGTQDYSGSFETKVQNWRWLDVVLGSESGTDPYTYSEADTPPSITLGENIDNPGSASTDEEQTFVGSVIESCTIRSSVGEPVMASFDFKASKSITDSSLSSNVALQDEAVYSFCGGSIELPGASTLPNIIDSVELSITNNWEMLYGLGSRITQNAVPKARDYSVKITLKYLDNDLIDAAKGAADPSSCDSPTEYATLVLNFTNGTRSIAITLSNVPITEFARNDELNTVLTEDITLTPQSMNAVEDNT